MADNGLATRIIGGVSIAVIAASLGFTMSATDDRYRGADALRDQERVLNLIHKLEDRLDAHAGGPPHVAASIELARITQIVEANAKRLEDNGERLRRMWGVINGLQANSAPKTIMEDLP